MSRKPINYNSVPKTIELFGRTIKVSDETGDISHKAYGEARYGCNQIALSSKAGGSEITDEEYKLTFIHEMLHFILNFTGFEAILRQNSSIDLEQFIELIASGIYQYEKSAKY